MHRWRKKYTHITSQVFQSQMGGTHAQKPQPRRELVSNNYLFGREREIEVGGSIGEDTLS